MKADGSRPCPPDLFHVVRCSRDPPVLPRVAACRLFSWLSSVPSCVGATSSLSHYPRTLRAFPCLGHRELCHRERRGTRSFMNKCFLTWGVDTQKGDRWATWLEGLPHCVRGGRTRSRPPFHEPARGFRLLHVLSGACRVLSC